MSVSNLDWKVNSVCNQDKRKDLKVETKVNSVVLFSYTEEKKKRMFHGSRAVFNKLSLKQQQTQTKAELILLQN